MVEITAQPSTEPLERVACASCGTPAPEAGPPPSWSAAVERGRKVWSCESCARTHIRSIEGKLDSQWW